MRIELHLPKQDKGYGVEIHEPKNFETYRHRSLLSNPIVKAARAFLQCEDKSYLFFEFWTDDMEKILAAKNEIESFYLQKV